MNLGSIRRFSVPLLLTALAFWALALSAAARSDGQSGASHDTRFEALAKVPEKARTKPNPFEGDPQSAAAGRKLYGQHCAECHGAMGEGGTKAPSLRLDEVHNATPGALFWILSNGVVRRGMPVWSKLPEPERWQIVSFLKSLPPVAGGNLSKTPDHKDSTP